MAAAASVDPALVTQYFGSKRELFSQVVQALPAPLTATDTEALVEQLPASLGLKLGGLPEGTLAVLRSMLTDQAAADQIRVALGRQIAGVGTALPADEDPELRAALVVTALLASPAAISSSAGASLCEAPADRIAALLRSAIKALVGPSSE
ncbi:MAG: TetR/AcrR family transcriptional regulator [Streptomyces sp.]